MREREKISPFTRAHALLYRAREMKGHDSANWFNFEIPNIDRSAAEDLLRLMELASSAVAQRDLARHHSLQAKKVILKDLYETPKFDYDPRRHEAHLGIPMEGNKLHALDQQLDLTERSLLNARYGSLALLDKQSALFRTIRLPNPVEIDPQNTPDEDRDLLTKASKQHAELARRLVESWAKPVYHAPPVLLPGTDSKTSLIYVEEAGYQQMRNLLTAGIERG